jgi:hypothetical protein
VNQRRVGRELVSLKSHDCRRYQVQDSVTLLLRCSPHVCTARLVTFVLKFSGAVI